MLVPCVLHMHAPQHMLCMHVLQLLLHMHVAHCCMRMGCVVHTCKVQVALPSPCALFRDNAKAVSDVEATTGQVKQAQDVVPSMERLVKGLEQQQAETMK